MSEPGRTSAADVPWTSEEFIAALQAQGARYHDLHPFHVRMNAGELSHDELQRWVINRYYYQRSIPLKDAAILSNCPEPDVRRVWIQRIVDHDGQEPGGGGVESWLRLGEALDVEREDLAANFQVLTYQYRDTFAIRFEIGHDVRKLLDIGDQRPEMLRIAVPQTA